MSKGISPAPIPRDRSEGVRKWLDSCGKWLVRRELGHRRECRNCGGKEAREGRGDTEEVLAAAYNVGAVVDVGGRDNVVVVAAVAVVDDIAVLVAIAVVLVVVAAAVVVVVVVPVVPVNVVALRFPSLQPVLLSSPMFFLFSVRGIQDDDIFPVIGVAVRSVWLVTVASSPFPHY